MWRRLSIAALSVTAALAVAFYGLVYWCNARFAAAA